MYTFKKLFGLALLSIFFVSCADRPVENAVKIEFERDTIALDEIFTAYLTVNHISSILPEFFIVIEPDTFLVMYDEPQDCAIFNTVGRSVGEKKYSGFVEYFDQDSIFRKHEYSIEFIVE